MSPIQPPSGFTFDYVWPYVGIGAAGLLVILLFASNTLQADLNSRRWTDIAWLTWLASCAYMLHQFEEYAVDATGAHYAFPAALCAQVGFPEVANCRVPPTFFTAVNVGSVWLAGVVSALLARGRPAVGLSFAGIPFVNVFAHVGPGVANGTYNSGMVTAVALFAPLSVWIFQVARKRYGLGWLAIVATIIGGLAVHGVLLVSLQAYLHGVIGIDQLVIAQILNAALPALVVLTALKIASPRQA
jgi:hypothetical protein